jgi:putative CocE/NonD family hydrolase
VQWLALSQNPPHLKAAVPGLTPIDSHHFFYVGGAASFGWMDWYMENILPDLRKRASDTTSGSTDPDRAESDWRNVREQYLAYRPLVDVPVLKKYAPEYYDWLAHPDKSAWWDFVSVTDDMPKVTAPVIAISGWYDAVYGTVGATEAFQRMTTSAGSDIARDHTRLILGPWNHTNPTLKKTRFGEIDFGASAGFDAEGEYLKFFDCELKAVCTTPVPRVSIFVMGENRWRNENEWPIARTVPTSYYLRAAGALNTSAPQNERPDSFVFDPANPVVDVQAANSVPYDQRAIEARRDVLVYTSDPLDSDMEVTGEVIAELLVRTSARDTDFAITFCDVYPDGRSINLSGLDSGYLRMRYRNGFEKQELVTPGEVYKIRIGGLITSNLFKKGHRIRLHVTSSKLPHYDPNPNTGTEIATETRLARALQTVEHSAEYPSRLILPVIPRK